MILSPILMLPFMAWMISATMKREAEATGLGVLLVMPAYFVGWMTSSFTLAEAKEKRVLESLLITPLRSWEYVAVEAGLGSVLSLVAGGLVVLIVGRVPERIGLLLFGYLLLTLFSVAGGTLIGLLVPDTRTLGSAGTPVLLLLMFGTTMPWELFPPAVWDAQVFLPTRPAMELLRAGYLGVEAPILQNILVMVGYTALVAYFCIYRLRRLAFSPR